MNDLINIVIKNFNKKLYEKYLQIDFTLSF